MKVKEPRDSNFRLLSWWKSEVVSNATVMVVGAGAIGNEVLKNLALMNVGNILIVDFDHIEFSNLAKSILFREEDCMSKSYKCEITAERVKEINPDIKTKTINGDIRIDVGHGLFRRVDVVIGCLDNLKARIALNKYSFNHNKIWIDGAIEDLVSQVNVYKQGVACYECGLSETAKRNLRRNSCGHVYQLNKSAGRIPTTPLSSSITAAIQVQEALKVIHDYDDYLMEDSSFYFDGMTNLVLQRDRKPIKPVCSSHEIFDDIIEIPLKASDTIQYFFEWIGDHLGFSEEAVLLLRNELTLEVVTLKSNQRVKTVIPTIRLEGEALKQFQVIENEAVKVIKSTTKISQQFGQKELTLHQIGIPPLDILEIMNDGKKQYLELTGDQGDFCFS